MALFLTLRIGTDYYALAGADVVEVLPLVNLKSFPQAPLGIAGLFDYRGATIPVVDLTLLAMGANSNVSMTTRIAVLNYAPVGSDGNLLGVMAEEMTDTFHAAAEDFVVTGVDAPQAAYLGPVMKRGERIVQRVDVSQLLSPEVRESLYKSLMN
ncbi:MAG: chemotaxis protein CheW [Candidatus Sumerlaeaceae bacterium]